MFSFKSIVDSALKVWNDSTPAARVGLVLLAATCIVIIAGVGYWSSQPTYVTLVSDVDANKVDKIIDGLDKAGIAHKISGAGGNVLVDQRQFAKAKNIANRLGGGVSGGDSGGMVGIFKSPSEKREMARLQKEADLKKTIERIQVIAEADVHLNIPARGPFEMYGANPSASVVVSVQDGAQLSYDHARSIANIISFAVEGMEPESVTVADELGRTYQIHDQDVQGVNDYVSIRKKEERELIQKAERQLFAFLGFGNASVQVSADFTINNETVESKTYDQKNKTANHEVIDSSKNKGLSGRDGGATGTESNLNTSVAGGSAQGQESTTEKLETSYSVPSTTSKKQLVSSTRNYLTASVVVNSNVEGITGEDGSLVAGIEDKVRTLVENAVGFNSKTDKISVDFMPFPEFAEEEPAAAPFDWASLNDILKNVSLAVAALVALVVGFLALKKFAPPVPSESQGQPLDDARVEGLKEIANMVNDNPEVFAQLVSVWAGAEAAQENEPQPTEAA